MTEVRLTMPPMERAEIMTRLSAAFDDVAGEMRVQIREIPVPIKFTIVEPQPGDEFTRSADCA